jgi:hypothetical protein
MLVHFSLLSCLNSFMSTRCAISAMVPSLRMGVLCVLGRGLSQAARFRRLDNSSGGRSEIVCGGERGWWNEGYFCVSEEVRGLVVM